MRPLAVLLLVLVAVAALVFAFFSITGSSEREDTAIGKVVRPAVELEEQRSADVVAAPENDRIEVETVEPERTQVEGSGAFSNELFGTVSNPMGLPVADARISIFRQRAPNNLSALAAMFQQGPPPKALKTTKTTEDGGYAVRGLPPGKEYMIVVEHGDYQRTEVGPVLIAEDGSVREDIRLQEGMLLFGYVRDHGSQMPIAGATVWIDDPLNAQLPSNRPSPSRRTTTSRDDGRYEFRHLEPGSKVMTCSAEGYGTVQENNVMIQMSNERHLEKTFQLEPEMTIGGRVFAPDRSPVEGATIDAISYNAQALSRGAAVSDADGNFLIRGLADAEYSVVARADGWGDKREVRVKAGVNNLQLEMVQLGGVMGRVVDASSGRPLSSFNVKVRMVNLNSTFVGRVAAQQNVRDAKNGAFYLKGLNQGHYVVEAVAKDYAATRSERFTVGQGITVPDILVQISRGGKIHGIVLDGYTNKPLVGALVSTEDNNYIDSPFTNIFKGLTSRTTSEASARTDKDGRFEFDLMTPELYQIKIQHPDYTSYLVNDIRINEGGDTDLGVVKLYHGAKVAGTCYLPDGSPAVGAQVSMHSLSGTGKAYDTRTNSEGRYLLRSVAPGDYKISASRPDQSKANPFQVIVDMKQSEVEITVIDGREYAQDLYLGGD